MASGLSRSLRDGHEEFVEWKCAQCETTGRNNDATVFCMDCNEHYCDDCLKPHMRIASLKLHKLLNKDQKESFDKRFKEHEAELKAKSEQIKQLQAKTSELNAKSLSMKQTLENLQTEKDNLATDHAQLKEEYVRLVIEKKQKDEEFQKSSTRIEELKKEIDYTRSKLELLTEEKNTMRRDMQELQYYSDDMSAKYQSLQNNANEDRKTYKSHLNKLTDDLRDTTEKLDSLKREHGGPSSRNNQLDSERLKHGNPDIDDLSDPNRAMKLAERFNDLYNDTWTDAFVAQQDMGISDKSSIGYLLDMLQECYKYCEEVARDQFESLTKVLLHPCQDPRQPVKKNSGLGQPRISTASKTILQDLRREIATQNIEEIIQAYLSHMHRQMKADQDRKRMEVCKTYYQKCVELCWLVVLHEPPLYMKTDVKPGSKVDLNYFSVMSKGDKVDYLVWPALLNGAGGGLLSKGVVETVQLVKKKGGK